MSGLQRAMTALVVMVIAGLVALRLGAPDSFNNVLADVGIAPATGSNTPITPAPAAAPASTPEQSPAATPPAPTPPDNSSNTTH